MSDTKPIRIVALLVFGWMAIGAHTRAREPQEPQPQEPTRPKPAGRGIPGTDGTVDQLDQGDQWQPDNSPLTGLQAPTLGSPEMRHSYWVPGLAYGNTAQSQPPALGGNGGWYVNNYVGGDLSLVQSWSRNQLGVNLSGGGLFTTQTGQDNGWYSMLTLSDSILLRRWQIQFSDSFSYLPESGFGFFGASGGLATPGVGGPLAASTPGLNPGVTPNQSVYSAVGPRYSNTFVSQLTYQLSRRGSITVGGSYALLRFTQPGNVDNDDVVGIGGYNYALSKTDTIGVFYQFYGFHYSGTPQAVGTNGVSLAYGKRITRKLALSLYGGPQFTHYRVPIGTQSNMTNGVAGANLTYAWQHGSVNGSYFHGITGGAGALVGALSDTATVGFSRLVGRVWSLNVNGGYARNTSLGAGTAFSSTTFNDWFLGGGVSRPFGRQVHFAANYTATRETSKQAACTTTPCSTSFTRSMVTVSLQWHTRPLVLE